MNVGDLKLYAITDRSWLKEGETLKEVTEQAILGGVTMIQLREKNMPYDEQKKLAIEIKQVCNKYNIPFIINDDVNLAKDIDADGVHVGQSDMAVEEARKILGYNKIVGATAKTVEQAVLAQKSGADYLGSGAIFGTTTKADAKPMTMELLNSICDSVNIPVVAIGGIDKNNVSELKEANIAGIAVVSGIYAEKNKRKAAIKLCDNLYGRKVIQCITNHVTVNSVANMILAIGASPIMSHHICEVEEVQKMASGLLLNLGATDDYEAMKIAYRTAINCGHPIVIDPVGVGGISFRRNFIKELLAIGSPSCIRGNFGEIKAIFEDINTMAGLDSDVSADSNIVKQLAERLGCIIVATGKEDIISGGEEVVVVSTGTPMQKEVTGAGCMLSGVICSILADNVVYDEDKKLVLNKRFLHSVAYACQYTGDMAVNAAKETEGSMSFCEKWIDLISL